MSQLSLDPSDGRHLALRSNLGLMITRDAGATWEFRCKAALGYDERDEPALAILHGGALLLGVSTGVRFGDAAGCQFRPAVGIHAHVVDVIAIPGTPGAALAVSVSYADSSSRVWKSLDNGRSFHALGPPIRRFTALSLGAPAAMPKRIYMTGLLWSGAVEGAFARSDDGGRSFTVTPIANSDSGAQPYIAALSPQRSDTLYLRFTGTPGRVSVSDDAGQTFREVLSIPGSVQGLAVSTNGQTVFASSLEAGIYRADAASLKFDRITCAGLPCLTPSGDALLGCGRQSSDGFIVGRSADQARSFSRTLDARCLGPASCGSQPSSAGSCAPSLLGPSAGAGQVDAECATGATSQPLSRACFEQPDRARSVDVIAPSVTRPVAKARVRIGRGAGSGCSLSKGLASRAMDPIPISVLLLIALSRRTRPREASRRLSRTPR